MCRLLPGSAGKMSIGHLDGWRSSGKHEPGRTPPGSAVAKFGARQGSDFLPETQRDGGAPPSQRLTIALVDQQKGWVFRLHAEDRRVWLDSLETGAPVPTIYVAGGRALELETVAGACRDVAQLLRVLKEILPSRVIAVPMPSLRS